MFRSGALRFMVMGLLLTVGACGGGSKGTSGVTKLKVAFPPFVSNAVLQLAQDDGYFGRENLKVQFIQVSSPGAVLPSLIRGDIDIIPGALDPGLINAIARGARIRIVAGKSRMSSPTCSYTAGVVRTAIAKRVASPADLRGLTFRAPESSTLVTEYFIDKVLAQGGLSRSDVKFVKVDVAAVPEALRKGQVDVVFTGDPGLARIVASGAGKVLYEARDYVPGFEAGVLEFGPSLLDKDPDAGRRFMVAYLKALRAYDQGATLHDVEVTSKFTQLDPALVKKMCLSAISPDGSLNMDSILKLEQWAKQNGYIDRVVTQAEFYDPRFLDYARSYVGS